MKEVSSVDAEVSKGKQIESGYHQKNLRDRKRKSNRDPPHPSPGGADK